MTDKDLVQAGYRYGLSLTHNEAEAENFVREAWARLFRSKRFVRRKVVLYAAIRHLFMDKYSGGEDSPTDYYDWEQQTPLREKKSEVELTLEDLDDSLGKLKGEEREVIYLSVCEKYSPEEIATIVEKPDSTVQSLLNMAMGKLNRHLSSASEEG